MTELSAEDAAAYAADAKETINADNILAQITVAAADLRAAREEVTKRETALKEAQDKVKVLETITLPELMDTAQQDRLKTTDGYEVERGETLRASIPEANLSQAILWLRSQQQDAIIRRDVKLQFGKGEDQRAAEAVDMLVGAGLAPVDKQSVHPQTLAATIREMLKDGVDVPMALLGAHVQPFVKVTAAKNKA